MNTYKNLFDASMKEAVKEKKKELTEDEFYELACDSFRKAYSKYEKKHPEVLDDNYDDVMWYDKFLDDGIIGDIMENLLQKGFVLK